MNCRQLFKKASTVAVAGFIADMSLVAKAGLGFDGNSGAHMRRSMT